jgi:hypothetical protein
MHRPTVCARRQLWRGESRLYVAMSGAFAISDAGISMQQRAVRRPVCHFAAVPIWWPLPRDIQSARPVRPRLDRDVPMRAAFAWIDTNATGDAHTPMCERTVWRPMHRLAVFPRIPVPQSVQSTRTVHLRRRGCVPVRPDLSANAAAAAHTNAAMRRRAVRRHVRDVAAVPVGRALLRWNRTVRDEHDGRVRVCLRDSHTGGDTCAAVHGDVRWSMQHFVSAVPLSSYQSMQWTGGAGLGRSVRDERGRRVCVCTDCPHTGGHTHTPVCERAVWRPVHRLAVPAGSPVPQSVQSIWTVHLRCRG